MIDSAELRRKDDPTYRGFDRSYRMREHLEAIRKEEQNEPLPCFGKYPLSKWCEECRFCEECKLESCETVVVSAQKEGEG